MASALAGIAPDPTGAVSQVDGRKEWEIWSRLEQGQTSKTIALAMKLPLNTVTKVIGQLANHARSHLREAQIATLTISTRRLHKLYEKMYELVDNEAGDNSERINAAKVCLGIIATQASIHKVGNERGMGSNLARFESMSDGEVERLAESVGLKRTERAVDKNYGKGVDSPE